MLFTAVSLLASVDLSCFSRPGQYFHGRIHSSGDLYPQLVGLQAFLLLADGFSCRLLWDDILVDQSLPETALSYYYGHSLVFVCRLLSSLVSPVCVCRRLTERSLGRALPSYLFGCGSSYFTEWGCVLLAPAISSLDLFSVYVVCSCVFFFASSFKDCEAGGWLHLFLCDFNLLDLFSLVFYW